MKAISLWQPWASAVALGLKRNETRSWPAVADGKRFRGWLAICAAKTQKDPDDGEPLAETFMDLLEYDPANLVAFQAAGMVSFDQLPFGKIVAVAWLENSVSTDGLQVSDLERCWGNFTADRFAWQFTECWRLNEPLPVRGEQKLFDVTMPAYLKDCATKIYSP